MKIIKVLCLVLLLFGFVIFWLWLSGYRLTYQVTPSMPKGFYWVYPAASFQKDDIVVFYPPHSVQPFLRDHPWAPNWLMKKVEGVAGDLICVKNGVVFINGKKIAHVYQFYAPSKPLPRLHFCRRLQLGEYFLLSPSVEHSFDSRYFGPVRDENIVGKAFKIFY